MFIAVFLHELGHNSLRWYGKEACDGPELGPREKEAGEYIEKAFFGGTSCAEFNLDPMHLVQTGITKDGVFYPIRESHILMLG
jgi:hypothetical protein